MMRSELTSLLTGLLVASLLLLSSACTEAAQPSAGGGIEVNGQGTIEVVPDMGRVTLHVRREGADAGALTATLNQVTADLIALTRQLGIEERDVTATALAISPRYARRGDGTVTDGVVASRTIEVVLRDLDSFVALMEQALALGVNNVDPIRLDSSRRAALEDEALSLAMEDAKAEALRVADGFGVRLGTVTRVQVGAHSPRPEAMRAVSMADSGPAFSTGVIRISRYLSATFAIEPGG